MDLQGLEDAALLARLKELVRREREDVADIVAHLAEVESRDLALRLAFPSRGTEVVCFPLKLNKLQKLLLQLLEVPPRLYA